MRMHAKRWGEQTWRWKQRYNDDVKGVLTGLSVLLFVLTLSPLFSIGIRHLSFISAPSFLSLYWFLAPLFSLVLCIFPLLSLSLLFLSALLSRFSYSSSLFTPLLCFPSFFPLSFFPRSMKVFTITKGWKKNSLFLCVFLLPPFLFSFPPHF